MLIASNASEQGLCKKLTYRLPTTASAVRQGVFKALLHSMMMDHIATQELVDGAVA